MLARTTISRIVAWDAFLSHPFGRRLQKSAPRWVSPAAGKVPSFDDTEPHRQRQAYIKQRRTDGPVKTGSLVKPTGIRPSVTDGKPVEMQRLAKVRERWPVQKQIIETQCENGQLLHAMTHP